MPVTIGKQKLDTLVIRNRLHNCQVDGQLCWIIETLIAVVINLVWRIAKLPQPFCCQGDDLTLMVQFQKPGLPVHLKTSHGTPFRHYLLWWKIQ